MHCQIWVVKVVLSLGHSFDSVRPARTLPLHGSSVSTGHRLSGEGRDGNPTCTHLVISWCPVNFYNSLRRIVSANPHPNKFLICCSTSSPVTTSVYTPPEASLSPLSSEVSGEEGRSVMTRRKSVHLFPRDLCDSPKGPRESRGFY